MNIVQEIREGFASLKDNKVKEIESLPQEYKAYIIRTTGLYGVAVKVSDDLKVNEKFNSCSFKTQLVSVGGIPATLLVLSSGFEEYRYEFASLCAEFVDPGDNGMNRIQILNSPLNWWRKWKELMGNTNREQRVYNVIAEMMVYEHKLKHDTTAVWSASSMGTHDIECKTESCEVKSTLKRYGAGIVISGQHQLEHKKPLFLYFCRMEESILGESINSMKDRLIAQGCESGKLEIELERQGFESGTSIRDKKYKILEKRKYTVDDSFPRITKDMFVSGCYPKGITHIEYTVDLDGIVYSEW